MQVKEPSNSGEAIAVCIRMAMEEKQAEAVQVLDLRNLGAVMDYFVLCTAKNAAHMSAIVSIVEERVKVHCKEAPWFVEGTAADHWMVVDYTDVVVHVFTEEKRAFYALEELWGDAQVVPAADQSA